LRYLDREVDLGARPPNCGRDKLGSLPWIFRIIKSEVCARVWTAAAFQASKNFRDDAQTRIEARASASLKVRELMHSAPELRGKGCGQLDEIGLAPGVGLGEDPHQMRLHRRFRDIEVACGVAAARLCLPLSVRPTS